MYGFGDKIKNLIGILDHKDVVNNRIVIDGRPVDKALLLVFMPTCPHCQEPKRWMEKAKLNQYGVYKLAIDVSNDRNKLAHQVPKLFGLDPNNFTVPRVYVIQNGRPVKELRKISHFDPVRDFTKKRARKVSRKRNMSRRRLR